MSAGRGRWRVLRLARRPWPPRSLRARLLAGVVLLVAAGLVASNLATYALLRSHFEARTERQLSRTAARVDEGLADGRDVRVIERTLILLAGNRIQAVLVDRDGRLLVPPSSPNPSREVLVAALGPDVVARLRRDPGRSEALVATPNEFRVAYRPVREAAAVPGTGSAAPVAGVVVAVSQREDLATLRHVAVSAAVVTSIVLVAVVLLAFGMLELGLRPLRQMAAAAAGIAGGDTARRVPAGHPHTEAGRLAVALNEAFDRRREAEERLRRFVADVSHELRTPLSTIGGWADLYFQGGVADRETTATAMSRIADEAAGMRSLVEELLLLADLDEERPLAKEPVDLVTLVGDVVSDARVIDPDRRITLAVSGDDGAAVLGDADRLRQLVRNLLSNALQHTPPGTAVHVALNGSDGSDGRDGASPAPVTLAVADEGPGIPAEAREHLFDRFYQGAPTRRRGNGLGLAIARAIVDAHGGTIRLRDPGSGAGSEFLVRLPAAPHEP
jgi:two-component system OmpR family sensor kinase